MSGSTCTFSRSSGTVAIFCENGCCANDCCIDDGIDDEAFAIAIAVIIGFILILIIVAILAYFYSKLARKRNRKKRVKRRNDVLPSIVHRKVQTGNPEPREKDRILVGEPQRWSSYPPARPTNKRKKWPWAAKTRENFTQTGEVKTAPVSRLDNLSHPPEKAVQTPGRRGRAGKRGPPPSTAQTAKPWRFSTGHKSLTTAPPAPLDTYANYNAEPWDPGYSTHRCPPPEYNLDESDMSRSQSVPPHSARSFDSEV